MGSHVLKLEALKVERRIDELKMRKNGSGKPLSEELSSEINALSIAWSILVVGVTIVAEMEKGRRST